VGHSETRKLNKFALPVTVRHGQIQWVAAQFMSQTGATLSRHLLRSGGSRDAPRLNPLFRCWSLNLANPAGVTRNSQSLKRYALSFLAVIQSRTVCLLRLNHSTVSATMKGEDPGTTASNGGVGILDHLAAVLAVPDISLSKIKPLVTPRPVGFLGT